MILMRSYDEDLTLEYLTKQGIPVGLTGSCADENVIQVDSDNNEAAHRMTSMLIDCGYKKFALILGESTYRVNHERIDGFYQAIDRYGLAREQQLCIRNFKWMGLMDNIIHDVMSNKVECVICGDDVICSRMMSRLQAEGYRIPLDIGIAALYNGATLDCFTPAVTAVNILARQQGITIGKQMIHCLKGEIYNKKTMLDYEILLRKSAGRTF
ncbi:MAG: substrate-binding domain-containing protein [Lachnospiraceae bacterium]